MDSLFPCQEEFGGTEGAASGANIWTKTISITTIFSTTGSITTMLTACSRRISQVISYPRADMVCFKTDKMGEQWRGLDTLELCGFSVCKEDLLRNLCALYMETTGHERPVLRKEIALS